MWPWAHLAVGYLVYAATRRRGRAPADVPVLALAVGALLPDLVDKPLAWFGPLPAGRSLAHSALVGLLVLGGFALLARRLARTAAFGGFAVGYLTHLGADAVDPIVLGDPGGHHYLLWPLLPVSPSPLVPVDPATRRVWAVYLVAQVAFAGLAVAIWRRHGAPGWRSFPVTTRR